MKRKYIDDILQKPIDILKGGNNYMYDFLCKKCLGEFQSNEYSEVEEFNEKFIGIECPHCGYKQKTQLIISKAFIERYPKYLPPTK